MLPAASRARSAAPVGHGGLGRRPRLVHPAAEETPEQLHTLWQDAVARSRTLVAEALSDGRVDRLARRPWADGRAPSLRWILVHLIEEYARHNGHADLFRESIDGSTGE